MLVAKVLQGTVPRQKAMKNSGNPTKEMIDQAGDDDLPSCGAADGNVGELLWTPPLLFSINLHPLSIFNIFSFTFQHSCWYQACAGRSFFQQGGRENPREIFNSLWCFEFLISLIFPFLYFADRKYPASSYLDFGHWMYRPWALVINYVRFSPPGGIYFRYTSSAGEWSRLIGRRLQRENLSSWSTLLLC